MNEYKVINGTNYNTATNDEVINVLEDCRLNNVRVVIDYGNVQTGESWKEEFDVTGRIGRSCGNIKIPILLFNKRSLGGTRILTECIIGIKESRGGKILYKHNKKIM